MSDFDLNSYLDAKLKNVDLDAKMERLRNTASTKNVRLEQAAAKIEANRANSWAGQLGLSTHDFLGSRVNDAASLVSGASRLVGQVTSLAPNALSMLQTVGVGEEGYDAVEYARQGKATSDERAMAARFAGADRLRAAGRAVNDTFDLTKIVDQTNRDQLNEQLGVGFQAEWDKVKSGDVVSGIAGLLMNAGSAAVNNPAAAREYILENIPQLFVGAVGKAGQAAMAASNVGYAADEYQKGIDTYRAANGGQLPPEEMRVQMARDAALLAVAEHASDKAMLGMGKVSKALRTAPDEAVDAATIGFKQAMMNVGKAGAGGLVTEAATEGYQTYLEGEIQGKPATAEEIYKGAVIGGIAGGGMSGGARAAAELIGKTPEKMEAKQKEVVKQIEETVAVKKAVETGDPKVFLDEKSKTYSPAKAIGVMMALAEKEGTTEEEFKTKLNEASTVLEELEVKRSLVDPKAVKGTIAELQEEIKNADPDEVPLLERELKGYQDQLIAMTDPKDKLGYGNRLKKIENEIKEAEAAFAGFTRLAAPAASVGEVKTSLEEANSPDPVVATKAASTLINLSMSAPDDVSPDAALKLADNLNNGLDEDQRKFLRKFSEARIAENELKTLSHVSKEILFGSPNYVGINEYRSRIGQAIVANNENRAQRQLATMGTFVQSHKAKAEIAETAPRGSQILKVGTNWEVNSGKRLGDKDLKANGGFNIPKNNTTLMDQIATEAKALELAHVQLLDAVTLRFDAKPVKSVSPTPAAPTISAPSPVSPASLFREKREREGRLNSDKSELNEKPPETVVQKPQPVNKVERITTPNPLTAFPPQPDKVVPPSSPTATPAAPVADAPVLQVASARQDSESDVVPPADKEDSVEATVEEVVEIQAALKQVQRAFNKVKRSNPRSLWSVVKQGLKESDLSDTYGNEWKKRYTMLKGKNPTDLSTMVSDGTLDAYLPFDMRGNPVKEQDSVEYIKEALRNRQYLTYETQLELDQLGLTIQELESHSIKEIQDAIAAIEEESTVATGQAEEAVETSEAGTVTAPVAEEATEVAPEATEQPVEATAETPVAEVAEEVEVEVEEEDDTTAPIGEQGRLSTLEKHNKDDDRSLAEMYADPAFNPVAQFINQKSTNDTYKTVRPLVRYKDFLTKLSTGVIDQFKTLIGRELEESDIVALEHFRKNAIKWNALVKAEIGAQSDKDGDFNFRFRDLSQFMVDRNGNELVVDENLLTAISHGAYSWAVDTASAPRMDKERINRMFGRNEDAEVSGRIWEIIKGMEGFEEVTINNIGDTIMKSLGLSLREGAPQDLLPKIKSALGARGMLVLAKEQLIKRETRLHSEITQHLAELKGEDSRDVPIMFIFPNYEKLESFKEVNKGTGGLIDSMMSAEPGQKYATKEPVKFTQEFAQHTQQEIAPEQRKAMERLHKTPHTVIPEMMKTLKGIGVALLLKVAGATDVNDGIHAINMESVEAQNRNLESQLMMMLDMMGVTDIDNMTDDQIAELGKTEYFVQGEVWKNFRAGITTRSLNQQTSKIHRYMFGRPNWTVKVDLSKPEQHDDLLIAFAAGLGMKTDDQPNDATIALLQNKMWEDDTRAAINAMVAGQTKGDWSGADIIADYAAGAEGMMTLQTLAMLAKYEAVYAVNPNGEVEVTMLVGADGKTNGPILTHLALGAASSVGGLLGMMERGGMFVKKDGVPTHYSEARGKKENRLKDLYEDLASKLVDSLTPSPELDALQVIIGKLRDSKTGNITSKARNLVKTPLTAFAFGSSMVGSIVAMENKFIADIYGTMESLAKDAKLAKGDPKKEEVLELRRAEFIAAMNTLLTAGGSKKLLDKDATISEMLTTPLDEVKGRTKPVENALRTAFQSVMGQVVENDDGRVEAVGPVPDTMNTYFAVFIQRRSDLNSTIGAAYSVYEAAYQSARDAYMEKLMDEGKLAFFTGKAGKGKDKRYALHDLTVEQENELRAEVAPLLPVAHTAFSVRTGDLKQGIYMGKQDAELSNNVLHKTVIRTNSSIKKANSNPDKQLAPHLETRSMVRVESDPGVAGTPYFIHSLDAANMHLALLDVNESLNVHDEIGNSVLDIKKAAGAINRATVNNMLAFSPAREALNMLERIVIAANEQVKAGKMTSESIGLMLKSWQNKVFAREKGMVDADVYVEYPNQQAAMEGMFQIALDNAIAADTLRLGAVGRLGFIDQYVWEGGQHEVPPSVREAAEKQYNEMVRKISPEAEQAMYQIISFAKRKPAANPQPAKQKESPDAMRAPKRLPLAGAAAATAAGQSVTPAQLAGMQATDRAQAIQAVADAGAAIDGTGMTAWGRLGSDPTVDPTIQRAFERNLIMMKGDVTRLLQPKLNTAERLIFDQVLRVLPDNTTFTLVDKYTPESLVLEKPHNNSRGWYVATVEGKQNEIYIKSADFVHSGLNKETILHEMIHAALAREVAAGTVSDTRQLVTDLQNLVDFLNKQEGADKFKHILKDKNAVQEILAWGLSNQAFQEWMSGIDYTESTTQKNYFVKAMDWFVKLVTKALFKSPTNGQEKAMDTVLRNASGLFQAASISNRAADLNLSQVAAPESYTTEQIFEELASDVKPTPEGDAARLRAVLATMVNKLAPLYGVFGPAIQNKTLSPQSIMASVQSGGLAPFASSAISAGLGYNEQVAFVLEQVEVTIRTAISGDAGQTSVAYRELSKLYNEAATKLKGKMPQDQYDFLFKTETGKNDMSDYLSRFAALGLVHPEINSLLQFTTDVVTAKEGAMFTERLTTAFLKMLEWLAGKWTKTNAGQNADSKLNSLASQLVLIESKRRARLNVEKNRSAAAIEETFRGVADKARDKVDGWLNSERVRNSPSNVIKAIGSVSSLAVKDRLDYLALGYKTFTDTYFKGNESTIAGLINELQGAKADNVIFYKLLRMTKFLEGKRKDLITNTTKVVLESFADKGKKLTDAQKRAISTVMLRTDMSALLDDFGVDGLLKLLKDKSALAKAIKDQEAKLADNSMQMFYLNAAEAMGYQMSNGNAGMDHTLLNAYAIARLHGTGQQTRVSEEQAAEVQPLIDQLGSLYALQFVPGDHKAEAAKVMEIENAREKGNGIELTLRLHQNLQKESKERLFKEQEALMTKGYTPEIYNHYIEVTTADAVKQSEMKQLGYGDGLKLSIDKDDDTDAGGKMMFARHGSGLQPYLSGTLSTTAMKAKGTVKHGGNMDFFSDQGQFNMNMMERIEKKKQAKINQMFKMRMHPGIETDNYLVPVLNPNGDVVNYRYMMQNRVRDNVLERDSRFEHLMGAMAGSIFDKESAPKQNAVIVKALKAQYDLEFKTRAISYVEIGPRAPDPKNRERYRLLPDATKMAIRDEWKSDTMYVRNDVLDINFGYRKKSLSDSLQQDPEAREGYRKFLAEFLGLLGGFVSIASDDADKKQRDAKAIIRIRNAEDIWQTFVREAKDIIVVKSGSTLVGNVVSNFSLLYAYGVPVRDMMRSHRIALRGALSYQKDSVELFNLETEVSTGVSKDMGAAKKRIVQLKDAIARNPVRELIEAGLMPSIVEDNEIDDDIYSHKSKFIAKLDDLTKKVNPHILNVGKALYMSHDTKLYKGLTQATQLSDFLARYTLYQHMTTKKDKPMLKSDAIQMASDAFINYDVPTHRNMQYANDMGLIRFTKYYLRIQKVILHLYKDNPARMLALMGMGMYFNTVPTVLDSSMFTRIGNNPLAWGALEYFFSFDDLLTAKAVMAPF